MAQIKPASQIEPKKTISVLIYGQPSVGKTTLACSASNAVLFDYDGGVHRINPAHMIPTLQVESWEDTQSALDTLANDPLFAGTKTIIIDTCGKMLDYMSESIMRRNPKMKQYDGSLSLKGYGERKKMFADFIRNLSVRGFNVVFVAHEKEDRNGDNTIIRPLVGGSSASDLIQELDLVGYMHFRGSKRFLSFNATDEYYAKNSCYIPDVELPVVVDCNGNPTAPNCFMETDVFGRFRAEQKKKLELTKRYNGLLDEINSVIAGITDVESLNSAVTTLASLDYIYDAQMRSRMALRAKVTELGATYDKENGIYVIA